MNDHKDHHNVEEKLNNITGTGNNAGKIDVFNSSNNDITNGEPKIHKCHRKDTPTSVPLSSQLTLTKVKKSLLTLVDLAGS